MTLIKLINIEGIVLQFEGYSNVTEKDIYEIIKKCNQVLSNAKIESEPLLILDRNNVKVNIFS